MWLLIAILFCAQQYFHKWIDYKKKLFLQSCTNQEGREVTVIDELKEVYELWNRFVLFFWWEGRLSMNDMKTISNWSLSKYSRREGNLCWGLVLSRNRMGEQFEGILVQAQCRWIFLWTASSQNLLLIIIITNYKSLGLFC